MRIASRKSEITIDFDTQQVQVSPHLSRIIATILSAVKGVSSVQLTDYGALRIVAVCDERIPVSEVLRTMARELRAPKVPFKDVSRSPLAKEPTLSFTFTGATLLEHGIAAGPDWTVPSWRQTLRQLTYGGLACGSFGLAWIGLLVPGIPTVPFVILTVFFADRASPAVRRTLLTSPVIGPAMRDWHVHRGIRRHMRLQVFLVTSGLVLLTVVLAPPSAVLYGAMSVILLGTAYLLSRLPVIEENEVEVVPVESRPASVPLRLVGA